jgi:protein-disulfide isomerase
MSILCIGCVPAQPQQEIVEPETQAEEIGEEPASEIEQTKEFTIVERLLPTGLIEIGDREAPVVLMMFTEHHCRYCKDFYAEHFPLLHRDFVEQGKVRLQIGILPLRKYIHSENAAISLLCAATQGKGIPMHELLFKIGANDREAQLNLAATLELNTVIYSQCLDSPDTLHTIERQKSLARSFDVTLVPTFFLNGVKTVGLPYYADLRGMIEEKL